MKRILITGASRGIGRAIACELAATGVSLVLHGRDMEALRETGQLVERRGAKIELLAADLSSDREAHKLATMALSRPIDSLVNNAGIAVIKPVNELSIEEWSRTLAVNVTAPFILTRTIAGSMGKGGSIVNILSVAARTGFPGWSAYCMSKFALEGFSQSLREELRPRGIRVVNIYPGATKTDIWNSIPGEWPLEEMMPPTEVARAVKYALDAPPEVCVENIIVGRTAGPV